VSFFSDTYDHACIVVYSALLTVENLSWSTSWTVTPVSLTCAEPFPTGAAISTECWL